MAIKKYFADADNTITSAFRSNLRERGTNASMGASDILETFSLYGQASSGSTELQRILVKFPVTEIISDRSLGSIPDSGNVSFYLRMFNARHNQTLPRQFTLNISAVSRSWEEGFGLDMEEYEDIVYPKNEGSTWMSASQTEAWTRMGGDYHDSPIYTDYFDKGTENLEVDVTLLVEEWIAGTKDNYGFGVHLTGTQEAYYSGSAGTDSAAGELNNLSGSQFNFYTKEFFARNSEFYYKKPVIEARWDNSLKDDRGYFWSSSSLAPASDNINTIFLYNVIRGRLTNIPGVGTGEIYVKIFDALSAGTDLTPTAVTGGFVSTGVYSASFALETTGTTVYDRWYDSGLATCYHTGTIGVNQVSSLEMSNYGKYVMNFTNLKHVYDHDETARFRLYVRNKNWSPTIYTVASSKIENITIPSASYSIFRIIDDLEIIPHATGALKYTEMSYDVSGNYFDLDMTVLESGYAYGIKLAFYNDSVLSYVEQPDTWKFRVEDLNER